MSWAVKETLLNAAGLRAAQGEGKAVLLKVKLSVLM